MPKFVPWDSQPLQEWAARHAKGQFVTLGGHSTHYQEAGNGDPVVLLHGFFYDSFMWQSNIDWLASRFKVYAPDLWGFGYSTRQPLDYGYSLYVEQLRAFMDALDIPRASLIGQSMGGGIAIQFSVEQPGRINKLVLVDAAGIPRKLPLTARFFALPGVGEALLGLNTNAIRKKNLKDFFIHRKERLTENYFLDVTRFHKIEGTTKVLITILRKDFFNTLSDEIQRLSRQDLPVMIVWGREDRAIPLEHGESMHRFLDGSRFEIVDDAGHVPNSERPEEFNQIVGEFLTE